MTDERSDGELLAGDAQAFGVFYRRHITAVLGFYARAGIDASDAADLTAETFAAALLARRRYRASDGPARAWLLGIARHKRADRARRFARDQQATRRLGLAAIELTERDRADWAAGEALAALAELPDGQAQAVRARVLDDEDYATIGRRLGVSEDAARRRVSRGLAALRMRMRGAR